MKEIVLPLCDGAPIDSTACFGKQNQSFYADITNSQMRSYLYTTCTELGAYQVAPSTGPSLISRVIQVDYTQQWCKWAFPDGTHNSIPSTPNLTYINRYGDLNFSADRLAFIGGYSDVWLDLTYHSNNASARYSTDLHPAYLLASGGHHWDSYGVGNISREAQSIQQVHFFEIRVVRRWLETFKSWRSGVKHAEL